MILGIALMAASMGTGESQAGVFLIFPFFVTTSPLGGLGGLLLVMGIFLTFIGWGLKDMEIVGAGGYDMHDEAVRGGDPGRGVKGRPRKTPLEKGRREGRPTTQVRGGAVVFLGPIPIVAGSDESMTRTLMLIGGIIMAVMIVFYLIIWLA